uniref:Phosphodiesterase n=1 Tax=Pyramimonas obovata TaxID=1411642 RepID=A0A7S0WFR5_9CHLO|mmetsp:Transcript_24331/g.53094  ORF Transcript_24331/g.53094 Transcript_24331/m.53094 type:complete len:602 (+) Transcript_24331:670-2475(+)
MSDSSETESPKDSPSSSLQDSGDGSLYLQKLKESGDPKSAALESLKELMSHKNLTMEQTNSLRDIARILEHSTHGDDFSLSEKYFVNTVKGRLTSDLDTQKYLLTFAEQQKAKTNRWVFSKVVNDVRFVRHSVERTASTEDIQHKIYAGPSMSDAVYEELQKIDSWNFDVFKVSTLCNGRPLQIIFHYILHARGFLKEFKIPTNVLENFMEAVETGYHNVPYHNRTHAADVVCRVAAMLDAEGFADDGTMVGRIRFLAVLLAAVVHDYDHPGTDNHYQVQSNTMLSRHFNQQSVLENSSLFHTLEMLRDKPTAALASLKDNQEAVIALVIKLVLATDMASHFNIVTNFRTKVVIPLQEMERSGSFNSCERDAAAAGRRHTRSMRLSLGPEHKAHAHHNDKRPSEQNRRQIHDEGPGSPASCSDLSMRSRKGSNGSSPLKGYSGFLKLDEQQQEMALVMALKVADIGHSYAPFNVHLAWSECLQEEFFSQGSKEIEAGRSPGMLKDPSKPGPMDPDTQIGFLNVIALPSTKVWSEVFPTSGLVMLSEGLENRTGWREVADHLHQDKGQEKRPSNEQEPEIGKAELEIGKAERGTPRALCTVP